MRVLSLLIFTVFTVNANALTSCGNAKSERNKGHLDWHKITNYQASSSYININGIICLGISRVNNKVEFIHYRDSSGAKREASISEASPRVQKEKLVYLKLPKVILL